MLACHQTCVGGQRHALHHRRDRGPSASIVITTSAPATASAGESATVAPSPSAFAAVRFHTDVMARAREVARHRRAHDPRCRERRSSEPQHRPDAAERLAGRSWWRTTIAVADCSIAFSIAGSTMSSTASPVVGVLGQQQPGLEVHAPAGAEVLRDQQRLHARLVERVEHLGDARRAAPAGADALREPVQRLALALA